MFLQLFQVVWIFLSSLGVICYNKWVLSEDHKNYSKDWCLMNSQPTFLFFYLFLTQWIMAALSKGCKPDKFEPHNSLKLSFTNICGLCSNVVEGESFLELHSLHSDSMWDKLGWLNWFWQLLCNRLSSLNLKGFCYSYAWSCSLCEGRISFSAGLNSRNIHKFLLMFSAGFTSLSILLLFPLSNTFFIFMNGF